MIFRKVPYFVSMLIFLLQGGYGMSGIANDKALRQLCGQSVNDTVFTVDDTSVSPLLESGMEPHYVWQQPMSAIGTTVPLLMGVGTLCLPTLTQANVFVREEVQLMRREVFDHRQFQFDNVMQYVPIVGVTGLGLLGVPSRHGTVPRFCRSVTGIAFTTFIVQPIKHFVYEERPSGVSNNSFPSGHTAFAFCGAEMLRLEYGKQSSWVPIVGYALAGFTALMRVYNDRHWTGDVLAGAAIGIVSADLADLFNGWFLDPLWKRWEKERVKKETILK